VPLLLRLAALQQCVAVDLLQLLLQPCCAADCCIGLLQAMFLQAVLLLQRLCLITITCTHVCSAAVFKK
jgi:hypothetical protein